MNQFVFESGPTRHIQVVQPREDVQEEAEEAEADFDGDAEHGAARQSTPEDGPAAHRLGGKGLGSADRRRRHVVFLRAAAIETAGDEQPQACLIKTRPRHRGFCNFFFNNFMSK